MVIYLDQAFFLNGLLDYLLLSVCGTLTATPLRRGRILLAAGAGGLYAVAGLLPGLRFLSSPAAEVLAAGGLCLAAFGPGRGLLRRSAVLLALAAAFCGVVLALTELFSAPAALVGRRVYYPVSFGVLVLTAGGAFGVMKWALGRLSHQGGDLARVSLWLMGRRRELLALRDTGNTLHDPISGRPVMVAEGALLDELLPGRGLSGKLEDPAALVEVLREVSPALRPRLIPYQTVGVRRGLLLAVEPEDIRIDGKRADILLAFSPGPVSDGGGYKALLGGSI